MNQLWCKLLLILFFLKYIAKLQFFFLNERCFGCFAWHISHWDIWIFGGGHNVIFRDWAVLRLFLYPWQFQEINEYVLFFPNGLVMCPVLLLNETFWQVQRNNHMYAQKCCNMYFECFNHCFTFAPGTFPLLLYTSLPWKACTSRRRDQGGTPSTPRPPSDLW